jgi:hypothetical protein
MFEVSGELHALVALLLWMAAGTHWIGDWSCHRAGGRGSEGKETLTPLPGSEFDGNLVTILTDLFRFHLEIGHEIIFPTPCNFTDTS